MNTSKNGFGATRLQEGKPIAYACKSLTQSEKNYEQIAIEELFAILFGCKRFYHYMYGHNVTIESDHKPLVLILKKTPSFCSSPVAEDATPVRQLQSKDHTCSRKQDISS